ncbi:MAG: 30S ribosomal protein S17 [Chloroflexi bacterium]|nr:30S ribosomal protein S17 [Chloroflexota bacterium]
MKDRRKIRIGRVVSNKMKKTVVVAVEWRKPHPLYKRLMRQITKFKAHDEENACQIGDVVRIEETRPLSKDKRWRVVEILAKGELVEALIDEPSVEPETSTGASEKDNDSTVQQTEGSR